MKWLRHSFMVYLWVVLLLAFAGGAWGETTLDKYDRITRDLQKISNEYNEISVNSQLTLQDLQEILPQLTQRVNGLQTEVNGLIKDSQDLTETSEGLLQKWINLKNGIDNLSSSIETLGTSFTILDSSIKRAERKSNTGLAIAIIAAVLAAIAAGYSIFSK